MSGFNGSAGDSPGTGGVGARSLRKVKRKKVSPGKRKSLGKETFEEEGKVRARGKADEVTLTPVRRRLAKEIRV